MTGRALYDFAVIEARRMGWELNLDLSGHRLSEFPHEVHYPGPMADVDFTPTGGPLWVLEMHIRHATERYGAYYEDMLLDDSYFPDFKAWQLSSSDREAALAKPASPLFCRPDHRCLGERQNAWWATPAGPSGMHRRDYQFVPRRAVLLPQKARDLPALFHRCLPSPLATRRRA